MIKKLFLTSALVVFLAMTAGLISVQQAAATSTPKGGWFLAPVEDVIPEIDFGDFTDRNGDGYLYAKLPPGFCANRGLGAAAPDCAAWIWRDNSN